MNSLRRTTTLFTECGGLVCEADSAASQRRLRIADDRLLEELGVRVLQADTNGALHDAVTSVSEADSSES